ncbi:O-Antigen ligase [Pelotomaculum sp. FP]|nr:O-Antigen ligase [Pelotomaculum sp. FP]
MVAVNWHRTTIKWVLAVFAPGLVGLAPFFRGLIFEREMSVHHYLAAVVSMLVLILLPCRLFNKCPGPACSGLKPESADGTANKRYQLLLRQLATSPFFLALAALTILYGLSFFQAINAREALFTWLRHLDYLLCFVLVFLATGIWEKGRPQAAFGRWSLTVFACSGTIVAAGGILTGQGIVSIQGGIIFGRLCSTFLYPNSMAAYLMATVLMVIHLATQNTRPLKAGVLAGMGFLTFLAIIGSQSRGIWTMLPLILVLLLLGQTARKKMILLTAGLLGLAVILSSFTVAPQVQEIQPNWCAFLWTLAGCLISGTTWAACAVRQQKKPYSKKVISMIAASCLILIVAAGAALINHRPPDALAPASTGKTLTSRITDTGMVENSFQARLVYYADALRMVKARPLLGWGGGGWKSGYPAYQSYNYTSTTVHNHFLQVWVETGTIGLMMFIIPFLFLFRSFWHLYSIRTTYALAPETWTAGTAALALGMHAVIDFDLSFGSIALLFWALLALFAYREVAEHIASAPYLSGSNRTSTRMNSHLHSTSAATAKKNFYGRNGYTGLDTPGLTLLLLLFLSLASICLAAGTFTLRAAVAKAQAYTLAVQKGDEKTALEYIRAASRWDRWSAQYPSAQAYLLIAEIGHEPDQQAKRALALASLDLVRRAVQLDSYNPEHRFLLARLYLANGQLEETLSEAAQAKTLQPWLINTYEEIASIYVNVAVQQFLRGQKETAGITLRQALAITHEAITKQDTLPPRLISLWESESALSLTPALALPAGQSALLLGDYNQARGFLTLACQAEDQKAQAVAQLWLGIAMQKSGDLSGATLQEKARRTYPELESEYAVIKILMGL